MNIKKYKIISALTMLLAMLIVQTGDIAKANDAPYKTYTFDGYGNIMETQTAYLPYETITKFGDEALSGPQDMFLSEDGLIYVADTGNSRIVVGNIKGELVKVIGKGILKTPKGVFVGEDKRVYVADRDAGAVIVFDENGEEITRYGKPTSPLYGDALSFLPIKVVVNRAGIMYVICESNTNGIVEISPTEGGLFLGYFGTNFAERSLQTIIYRAILTDEQRAKLVANEPATPDNLCIDDKGLIYTVTRGEKNDTLKHLNIAGNNIIKPEVFDPIPAAVSAGNHDNVYMVSQKGYIYEFNDEGEILYVFGAADDGSQRVGLCSLVSAISVDDEDRIYILDADKAQIQVYSPTEFTVLLHEALNLYSDGRYTESKEPLTEVLEMNALFDYANKAMGRAYFQEENYEMAKYYARIAKDYQGYSDASWEIRNLLLKKYIVPAILVIFGIWILSTVLSALDKRKKIFDPIRSFFAKAGEKRFLSDLKYAWYYMKHPIDGSYGIAREGRASLLTANILIVLFMAEFIVYKYLCGFLWKTVREGQYDIMNDMVMIACVALGLTVCTYLISTINDGEGTAPKLYCMFAYSRTPDITFIPVVFVLSHVLTKNEGFLVSFGMIFILTWTAVLMILGIKEVNNYTGKETVKVLFLVAFAALILVLLIFIIYVLWAQVFEFLSALIGEVVYRIGS